LAEETLAAGRGVISTQVLQEYDVNVTRKLDVAPLAATSVVQSFRISDVLAASCGHGYLRHAPVGACQSAPLLQCRRS